MWDLIKIAGGLLAAMLALTFLIQFLRSIPDLIGQLLGLLFDLICSIFSRRHGRHEPVSEQTVTPPRPLPAPAPARRTPAPTLPYERKRYLLTLPEKHFFNVLSDIVPDDIYICPQVCFGGVLNVTAPTREYMFHWNRVQAKRIYSLLCDRRTLTSLVAVELRSTTH